MIGSVKSTRWQETLMIPCRWRSIVVVYCLDR